MNSDTSNSAAPEAAGGRVIIDVRKLSPAEFARLGLSQLAYVKPAVVDGAPGFAIHAADGTPVALANDRNVAVAAIVQQEMVPASVH